MDDLEKRMLALEGIVKNEVKMNKEFRGEVLVWFNQLWKNMDLLKQSLKTIKEVADGQTHEKDS